MPKAKITFKEIKELMAEGFSIKQIAGLRELSESRVYQILLEHADRRQVRIGVPQLPEEVRDDYPLETAPYSVGAVDMLLVRLHQHHTLKDVVNYI